MNRKQKENASCFQWSMFQMGLDLVKQLFCRKIKKDNRIAVVIAIQKLFIARSQNEVSVFAKMYHGWRLGETALKRWRTNQNRPYSAKSAISQEKCFIDLDEATIIL